ncbi:23S rRNA (guanosine(2251)-2'-O)-methyltransferase RlmB [Suttonella sp. R2A3]|uniref:23S rRNA (guanosine(2251)-2'-O)-methyltransferase RlmB n=1 Tax=Suttonella sp. R2A3 TaxID=2908648 RepID=UPI001F4431EB|nr:23S rRNA (guanosine(2251)-2'-O)-methyltransferase RlmB [Suttonella sp. R2A3]UJF24894.1 23S rRNA (guanosine(2251)-2'-O)-methyltransferase RlmB [Suttonella sp. R2A3]
MKTQQWIGGVHALTQALEKGQILRIQVADNKRSKKVLALIEAAQAAGVSVETVPAYAIDMTLPGVKHQGVIAAVRQESGQAHDWQSAIAGVENPLILILDSIQDPHNLGACLRSAAAAGVDAVLIPNSRAAEVNATVKKVACGGADIVPVFSVANLRREIQQMQQQGIWVVGGAGETEQTLYEVDLNLPLAIVVGNEGDGIHYGIRQQCDYLAAIPMDERMESLNVSVACALMLFEARRQRYFR